jgi:putative transposase
MLRLEGIVVGRRHVATMMRKIGIEALYRRLNTSRRHPRHLIYPYLLRKLVIDRPNQVWGPNFKMRTTMFFVVESSGNTP